MTGTSSRWQTTVNTPAIDLGPCPCGQPATRRTPTLEHVCADCYDPDAARAHGGSRTRYHTPDYADRLWQLTEGLGDWTTQGLCRGADTNLFFPARFGGPGAPRAAKAVCAACPVRTECLEYALTAGEKHGIWGGLSERERRKVRRQRAANARPNRNVTVSGKPIEHGTYNGAQAHIRLGEDPCPPCRAARLEYNQDRAAGRKEGAA